MRAYKCRYSYCQDPIHYRGCIECDVFLIPNYVKENSHFVIRVESGKLIFSVTENLPTERKKMYGLSVYNIAEIEFDKKCADMCYELYKKEQDLIKENNDMAKAIPEIKTKFDIFEKEFHKGMMLFKECKYEESIKVFSNIAEKYPEISDSKNAVYNVACCYSILKNYNKTLEYLAKAFELGYYNWAHMIIDTDLQEIINDKRFVNIVRKMIEKDPIHQLWSLQLDPYLIVHGLSNYRDEKEQEYEKKSMENKTKLRVQLLL